MTAVGCMPNGNTVVFVQLILYFLAAFLGYFVTIPVGIVLRNFHGSCILFAQIVKWGSNIIYVWSETSCDFVLYMNLAINIFYGTFMGALVLFVLVRRSSDKSAKFSLVQDWHVSYILSGLNPVMLLVNFLIVTMELSGASILTAGLREFCNYTVEYAKALPAHANTTNVHVPQSCAELDSRWNYQWKELRIIRGTTKGVHGENFFGCLVVATIASWLLLIVWLSQLALNVGMACKVCSCDVAEEKKKPDKSLIVAARRSRMATPIATPGGYMTPGGDSRGRYTPQPYAPPSRDPKGPPSRDVVPPPSRKYEPPSYKDVSQASSMEEKKPLPDSDDDSYNPPPPTFRPPPASAYEPPPASVRPPPTMRPPPTKQMYRGGDSELI